MKIKLGISTSIIFAALWGTAQVLAQQPSTDQHAAEQQARDRDESQNGQHALGKMEKASKILGREVKDSDNQKLGKIKDLAIDLQNGRILEVIVARGGMMGVDEQLVAVPPGKFTCDAAEKAVQLNTDRARFNAAPVFKMSDWESNIHEADVTQVYQYYDARPYFGSDNSGMLKHLGDVERASKLIGTTTRNLQNEKLGKVENLMVDLPAGRVVEVILASGGFLGIDKELSAVPPQSFHFGAERNTLVLDTDKQSLTRAPHFKSADWDSANNPDQVVTVYHSYNVEPYFATTNAVDNTSQNVRDRQDNTLTPLNQGNSQADVDLTRQIRQQIMALNGLSVDAQNVKVITINGRVTLRGPVNSEEEKQQIADIAAKATPSANVDDQLMVIKDSTTTTNSLEIKNQ